MAKNLKINIKNTQIAAAVDLGGIKEKLAKKRTKPKKKDDTTTEAQEKVEKEEAPKKRVRARSKSVFAEKSEEDKEGEEELKEEESTEVQKIVEEELTMEEAAVEDEVEVAVVEEVKQKPEPLKMISIPKKVKTHPSISPDSKSSEQLGPTGKHVRDLIPPKKAKPTQPKKEPRKETSNQDRKPQPSPGVEEKDPHRGSKGKPKSAKFKDFQDYKPKRSDSVKGFDSRDRHGLRGDEETGGFRRKKSSKQSRGKLEVAVVRPTELSVRLPITLKDLASEMKLKSSELIQKLFLSGTILTINDYLDDETIVQLLGHEFGCEIQIDTSEAERIRITDQTVAEEISGIDESKLNIRPPVIAFMGHVDHGKTSLIDTIRKSHIAEGEAGAITQHIGAFHCHTEVGNLTILDTPGHEAFSAMRARGADVTDIVVLVVAGDEGIRAQTIEAIQHAKAAGVTIVVAINKCDKPNFNVENVYRQLSEQDLLPEAWGGDTITVNCSAVTGEGITPLLEMLALQAEVLELRAASDHRARGRVLESELHKGMGLTATLLILNGTLKSGDALVFDQHWGRVKTMRDDLGKIVSEAGPSSAIEVTGLSGLPEAGQEFIVVSNEKEARDISEKRMDEFKLTSQKMKRMTMETLFQQATEGEKKILNLILRGDVQGSVEALKTALQKIESDKADLNIIFNGVGEISESDVQLAVASKAVILGFHVQVESHADLLIKETGVQVRLHDIIYHAIDDVKALMSGLLDRIAEEHDRGKAEVLETFKSSQYGIIAGCIVFEGSIHRNHRLRLIREGQVVWKGGMQSLRRVKEDVREVQKGVECGILLDGCKDVQQGDVIQSYEIVYKEQQL